VGDRFRGCRTLDTIPLVQLRWDWRDSSPMFLFTDRPPPWDAAIFQGSAADLFMKLTSEACYRCYLIMEILRSTGEKEFPLQLASCFFYIASHDGCLQEEVVSFTKLSQSAVSRNVSWLGSHHRLEHRQGLKLIRRERDAADYKKYRCFLTPKGQQFANLIEQHMSMSISNFEASARELMTMEDDD
jgi:DNA-binding MarR family transcriptional regulator